LGCHDEVGTHDRILLSNASCAAALSSLQSQKITAPA
jgi:hypothetical protein